VFREGESEFTGGTIVQTKKLPGRIALALLLTIAAAQGLFAAPRCTNRDFNGVYGTIARGTLNELPPVFSPLVGPAIRVARTTADGNGNVSEVSYVTYNGNIVHEPFSGTYSVNPDCTIVINWTEPLPIIVNGVVVQFSPPVSIQFAGALADGGSDVSVAITSVASGPPGAEVRVHMQRQNKGDGSGDAPKLACSTRLLSGRYQLDMYGDVIDTSHYPWPSLPTLSFVRQGTLSFDGNGSFSGDTVANYGGLAVVPEALKGTYSIDDACNVTMQYALGASYTWAGVTIAGGDGADLMIIAPDGAVIGGTLLRQTASRE
jgi:hypothetical protein